MGCLGRTLDSEKSGRAQHYTLKYFVVVVLQMAVYAEARTQRRCEQTTAGSGTDKCKRRKSELHRARPRPFVNHYINTVILHSRVQILLDHGAQTVYLVDKEHIVFLKRGKQTGKIARFVEHRARSYLESDTKLVGDNLRQCCLAKARRAVQEHMVKRFATHLGGGDKHAEILHDFLLTTESAEPRGAQRTFDIIFRTVGRER